MNRGKKSLPHSMLPLLLASAVAMAWQGAARADYVPNKYTEPGTGMVLEYNVFVPAGYNAANKYPLMVVMHAAGGTLPRTLSSSGKGWAQTFIDSPHQSRDPSFFLIPISQTDASGWGDPNGAISGTQKFEGRLTVVVLKDLLTRYSIDPSRLYVTGPSMGGRGTWDIIRRQPTLFAAAAPMAAPASAADAALYAGQNIWAVNGENDSTVQPNRDTITAIRRLGGNPIYTELANHGHDTWRTVYPDPQFLDWVYAQRLGVPWTAVSKAPVIAGLTGPAVVAPVGAGGNSGGGFAGASGAGVGGAGGRSSGSVGGSSGSSGQAGAGNTGSGGAAGGQVGQSGGASNPGTGGGSANGGSGIPGGGGAGLFGGPATGGVTASGGQSGTGGNGTGTGAPGTGGSATSGTGGTGTSSGGQATGDGAVGCSHLSGRASSWSAVVVLVLSLLPLLFGVLRLRRRRRSPA